MLQKLQITEISEGGFDLLTDIYHKNPITVTSPISTKHVSAATFQGIYRKSV